MVTSPIESPVAAPRRVASKHVHHHAGCEFYYVVRGKGTPVVFIHGVGVHGGGWRPQTDELATDFSCLTFDNRGLGRSRPAARPITVRQMADDARALMDVMGWRSAHVVGHSLGGMVAMQLALDRPDRVRSLSLLCTFADGRAAAPPSPRMLWLGLRSRVGTRAMRRAGFLELVMPPREHESPAITALADTLPELFGHDLADQPAIVNDQLRAMREADLSGRLERLALIPTLVVCATHDPIAPPAVAREISRRIPGAHLVEYTDASHGLPITHAADLNGLLRQHLLLAESRWPAFPGVA